jgi:branched-chain amino acid transport system ATP-binding protein
VVALPRMRGARSTRGATVRATPAHATRRRSILERVGLRGRESVRREDLAYGERRALEIGLALATSPRILFLDEPTSGLGANGTARLLDLVSEIKRTLTLVLIEHDMRFLFRLADQINVIHWGQVIARGTPDALRDNEWVRRSALSTLAC